jgi:hypothetical protein
VTGTLARSDSAAARIAAVARKEVVDIFRDRRAILVTLVTAIVAGPVMILLVLNLVARQADKVREMTLPIVGGDRAPALVAFLERQQVTLTPGARRFRGPREARRSRHRARGRRRIRGRRREGKACDGAPRLRSLARPRAARRSPRSRRCCAPTTANGDAGASCCEAWPARSRIRSTWSRAISRHRKAPARSFCS